AQLHHSDSGWLDSLHIQNLLRTAFPRSLDYRFNPQLNYANDHPFMLNAFLHANRVSFVNSVDCYFITLAEAGPGHVSRASLSAAEQLKFLHDCFGLLALARGQGSATAKLSGRMRADYWNRLLKLHLPMLLLRKTVDDAAADLGAAATNLAEIYGAQTSRSRQAPGAARMLEALTTTDGPQLVQTARAVRSDPTNKH